MIELLFAQVNSKTRTCMRLARRQRLAPGSRKGAIILPQSTVKGACMDADLNRDAEARIEVLTHSTVIAIVGRSNDHYYTSYQVGEYFERHGFTVYNVNPNLDEIDG